MDTPSFLCLKEVAQGFKTLGQFFFFMDFVCVWYHSFFLASKVVLHSALKTTGDFFDIEHFFGPTEKREVDLQH